jgi:topoisomerase-4 subunit A
VKNIVNSNVVDFKDTLEDKYFAYALSTIMSRSLPDLRDGLKPVHRRLLHAMHELKLDPKSGYKKCARIVGDVIGKFHPHGDVSVYDALVRMAQSFSMRYPIIEGQGNFGSVDGDSQAAMRYTEAKLTPYAMLLLADIGNDTVDFRPTYDGSDEEPLVLPSAVPNILANGSEGIAVGMATSIPPHNILELFEVLILLANDKDVSYSEIFNIFYGPDFPTAGLMVKDELSLIKAYETGRGSFRLRAKWHKEELNRGKYQIIITEIPYQVNKRKVIEQLAELYQDKKIPFIENFQDQSAEDIRIAIMPKNSGLEAEAIMESLYKQTELESKVQLNLNVLNSNSEPRVMGLKEVLYGFLDHRRVVLRRKMQHRLLSINSRLEILDGIIIAYLNLDEVIRIIREEDEPKSIMMAKWGLSDVQAESILNTRLRALRKLEEHEIKHEHDELTLEKQSLEAILNSTQNFEKYLRKDLEATKKLLMKDSNSVRKTQIIELQSIDTGNLNIAIDKYPITVTLSKQGWLKAFKEHNPAALKYREGDEGRFVLTGYSTDKVIIFSSLGKFYNVEAGVLPQGRGDGEPIKLAFNFADTEEVVAFFLYTLETKYLVASQDGHGFVLGSDDMLSYTKAGKQVLNVGNSVAIACLKLEGQYVLSLGENRRLLVFGVEEIPQMKRGKGVILQKFKHGGIAKLQIFSSEEELCAHLPRGLKTLDLWRARRATYGRLVFGKTLLD